jgi:hypothetical protein
MTSFNDTWVSEKKARAHYEGFRFERMNERTTKNGKLLSDFVVCDLNTPTECFRHTMLTIDGKYGPYNVITLEREVFVPGGENYMGRLDM